MVWIGLPHLRAPGASVPMVAPYATSLKHRSRTPAPSLIPVNNPLERILREIRRRTRVVAAHSRMTGNRPSTCRGQATPTSRDRMVDQTLLEHHLGTSMPSRGRPPRHYPCEVLMGCPPAPSEEPDSRLRPARQGLAAALPGRTFPLWRGGQEPRRPREHDGPSRGAARHP